MKFSGVEIDLIFAQLMISQVNDDLDLRDNTLLKGLDEASLRSVNGELFHHTVSPEPYLTGLCFTQVRELQMRSCI